jgi:hypothetical protein
MIIYFTIAIFSFIFLIVSSYMDKVFNREDWKFVILFSTVIFLISILWPAVILALILFTLLDRFGD